MSSSTKQAITASFIKLVSKKPLEKITVRDIVNDCGINRNTFYYHFQDIFAVLEEICYQATARINTELPFGKMLEDFFLSLSDYAEQHPKATRHLAASVGERGTERYFARHLDKIIFAKITAGAPDAALDMQRTATVFIRHALIGLYLDFIDYQGKIDKSNLATRIGALAEGVLAALSH